MTVLVTLGRGEKRKYIASAASDTITVPIGGGAQGLNATVEDLKYIEKVLQINLTTDPVVDTSLPENISASKNAVGATIVFGAGTTVSAEFIALGY